MKQKFAPSRLTINDGDIQFSLFLKLLFDVWEVWDVVCTLGLWGGLQHKVLLLGDVAPHKTELMAWLVFLNGAVCHLKVSPSILDCGLRRGVRMNLDDHLLIIWFKEGLQRAFLRPTL